MLTLLCEVKVVSNTNNYNEDVCDYNLSIFNLRIMPRGIHMYIVRMVLWLRVLAN
jgi:hypothetical protein